jgi:predicted dehydrogenase
LTPAAHTGAPRRVALVGYGLGGATFHAPLIASTSALQLTTVVTSSPDRRRAVEQRYPNVRVVDSVDALWKLAPALDLVVISSPNHTHVPIALAAVAAGLHVVVDKPFALNADEARLIADHARRRGRLAIPYHNRRWDGDFLTVRRLLREDALGDVYRFESRFERWRPAPKARWAAPEGPERGEGVLMDLGPHLVDQALVLFGPVVSVYAQLDRRNAEVTVPDDAFVALTHASGVRSHLRASTAAAQSGPRMTVWGSRAAYVKHGLDVQENALRAGALPGAPDWGEEPRERWGQLGVGDVLRAVPTERGSYEQFYQGVADALLQGAPPPVSAEDGAAVLDVLDAARRSAADDRPVTLAPAP